MKQLNLTPKGGIYFDQLQGMCDMSFALEQKGYAVFTYVPYGPIKEVTPYLLRYLEENSDIMGAVGKLHKQQRRMIWAELKRRVFSV